MIPRPMARSKRPRPTAHTIYFPASASSSRVCPGTRSSRIRVANCFDQSLDRQANRFSPHSPANVGQARRRFESSVNTDPTGGINPIAPSLPFNRIRAGMSGCCHASVRTDQAWRDTSPVHVRPAGWPCLTDVFCRLPVPRRTAVALPRERWDGSGGSRLAGPLDSGEDISGTSRQVVGALAHRRTTQMARNSNEGFVAAAHPLRGLGRRPLESVCAAWPRATARAGRAWQDMQHSRRRATVWR
jgi:hypothetical protein